MKSTSLALVFAACGTLPLLAVACDKILPGSGTPNAAGGSSSDGPGAVDISSAAADPESWMLFSAPEHQVQARFPAAPKESDMSTPTDAGTIPGVSFMCERAGEFLALNVLTFPESMEVSLEGGLDGARDGMINSIQGTILSEERVEMYGHPGRKIAARATDNGMQLRIEARLFWVYPRMYQLMSVAEEGSTSGMSEKFFSNFRLSKP